MRLLHYGCFTFAIFSVPMEHSSIETAADEVLSIMRKLYISDCLTVTNIGSGAGFVFHDIEEMHFSFRCADQEEMADFGEEANHLVAWFLTAHPSKDILLRKIAVLNKKDVTSPPRL